MTFLYVDYCIGRNCHTRNRDATMRRALKQTPFDFISHSFVQRIDFRFQISAILLALLLQPQCNCPTDGDATLHL